MGLLWVLASSVSAWLPAASAAALTDPGCAGDRALANCSLGGGVGGEPSDGGAPAAGSARVCGQWCDAVGADVRCSIDQSVRACKGPWCTTTCGLWALSILGGRNSKRVPCETFARGLAYPIGAEVCKAGCLLPEIGPDRYPEPTGLGLLCKPGTCEPAVQSRFENRSEATQQGLGVLQCPCNWFGADCPDDMRPVRAVRSVALGDWRVLQLLVDADVWASVTSTYKPGGVVRVQHVGADGVLREQPYALAASRGPGGDDGLGALEVLAGPADDALDAAFTEVGRRLRALPDGAVENLYVNPAVSGFFNRHYEALTLDASAGHLVIVATGTGLGGVLSAVQEALAAGRPVHLFYGLRDLRHLPYRGLLESLAGSGVDLTLLVTGAAAEAKRLEPSERGLAAALDRGDALVALAGRKLYVQDAMALAFKAGALRDAGVSLRTAEVAVCGRAELLRDVPALLRGLCGAGAEECEDLIRRRVFTNI